MEYYSSPEEVMQYTGVKPQDLGLEETEELIEVLEGWLVQIKDIIDQDRNRNYHQVEGGVPPGINHIAMRVCANVVAQASFRRESTIVQVDDYKVQMVDDNIFTEPIMRDLSRYPRKPRFGMMVMKKREE
ncbi:MAG: hypothetical protein QMD71_06305 [bacterium]|nr:hypothetical protein [bacterium]